MNERPDNLDRLTELLGDRATGPLSEAEQVELDALLRNTPGARAIAESFDRVEGGLVGAMHADGQPLPAELRASLMARGRESITQSREFGEFAVPLSIPIRLGGDRGVNAHRGDRVARARPSDGFALVHRMGWLAAAAAIALAAVAWWPRVAGVTDPLSPAELRTALIQSDSDAMTLVLDPSEEPGAQGYQGVVAEVVWSQSRQEGYLRVRGLPASDFAQSQYQLWITDSTRDDRYPVSGGVFDISLASADPVTGEVIIPIKPGVAVGRATAFALTLERAGGAVVPEGPTLLRGVA